MYHFTFGEFVNGTEYEKLIKEIFEDMKEKKTYEQGLDDAWEAVRKIANLPFDEETKVFGTGVHGCSIITKKFTAAEAIAKIKEYEDKQEEIKVGDELKFSSVATEERLIIGIVFEITKYSDGNWAYHLWTPFELNKNYVLIKSDFSKRLVGKTGKHYPQVEELLKAMKEGQ